MCILSDVGSSLVISRVYTCNGCVGIPRISHFVSEICSGMGIGNGVCAYDGMNSLRSRAVTWSALFLADTVIY